jgi:aminomethyltransferase
LTHLRERLGGGTTVEPLDDRALLALQGPAAVAVLARFDDGIARLPFMTAAEIMLDSRRCLVTRSGYTGEDGFEISLAADDAAALAEQLLAEPEVKPAGLGARDSLRLEAGLCLWGHDIDETTTPVEADLAWAIGRHRRAAAGFPGAAIVLRQLSEGAARKRVGLRPEGRAPAREGTPVADAAGHEVGRVTSGGFGPSVGAPVAMGYVAAAHAVVGAPIELLVRGTARPGRVASLPFVPHRYFRG